MIPEDDYVVIRRPVKRARLEYTRTGLRVIVPIFHPGNIPSFLKQFEPWIKKKQRYFAALQLRAQGVSFQHRSIAELDFLMKSFVNEAAASFQVEPKGLRYRQMKRQWGNCTNVGVLTFNKQLAALPSQLIRYIAYHEVCHLRSLRHGKLFRKLMLKQFPDIKQYEQLLTLYGYRLGLEQ